MMNKELIQAKLDAIQYLSIALHQDVRADNFTNPIVRQMFNNLFQTARELEDLTTER